MLVSMTPKVREALKARGVESFHGPAARVPSHAMFEPPCSIKWMQIENNMRLGAFSYAVSGYYSEVTIGRYVSIGEEVQIGRAAHPLTWVSTSPFFYLRQKIFDLGDGFNSAGEYHRYLPPIRSGAKSTQFRHTVVGNDVYIGHGAFIMPGVVVGDGAVVGAMSVVTKDVPAFGVVAGNPARLVKMRLSPAVVAGLLDAKWWRYAPWQLTSIDCSSPERAVDELHRFAEREAPYEPEAFRLAAVVE